jgi:prevent-host-death family protein
MKSISAGKFKDQCLRIMDRVARTRTPVVVSKRKQPIVKVVPYRAADESRGGLEGSILHEHGSPFRTGEKWDEDLP